MKNHIVAARNKLFFVFYKVVLKPIFFRMDPEDVHDRMTVVGKVLGKYRISQLFSRALFGYSHPSLEQTVFGIKFENPVGLAAGFDKNGELTDIIPFVGFGFEEIGSVTGNRCEGNPKPRLWRLQKSEGLVVYYGLKNDGSEAIRARLLGKKFERPIGTSVAMTNCKENMELSTAVRDYAKAFTAFTDIGHYFTINISCPNAEGGQPFVDADKLDILLDSLDTIYTSKPVFIKLSPDITMEKVDAILDVAKKHRVHGIVVTNLTKKRDNPAILDPNIPAHGGISGKPVQSMSDDLIAHIYKRESGRFVIVGCGGIFTAEDAYRKICLGATLLQLITGMIYQGPQVIGEINRGIVRLLSRDGYANISEAIGTAHNKQK